MTNGTPIATFRDPAGSLSLEGDFAVRTIHPEARDQVMEFVTSPFCKRLQDRGDMVASTIKNTPAGLQLFHPRVPVPTYPWEWTPSQWLAAAELTLTLCAEALKDGWVLKDATPLNILFVGSRPVLVDVLSFERWDPAPKEYPSHIWLAYGQYVRTFLLPLLMNRLLSWPLELSLFKRDGYEPAELYKALSWRQRLSPEAFWPVTLAARLDAKDGEKRSVKAAPQHKSPDLALHLQKRTLETLRKQTGRAMPEYAGSEWSNYTATLTPLLSAGERAEARMGAPRARGAEALARAGHWSKHGVFSALAAEQGAQVVALERDAAAAESLYRMTRNSKLPIQTIHADLSRPTPAVGWENTRPAACWTGWRRSQRWC